MQKRGRPSAASLSVVRPGLISEVPRPKAPSELTDEQAHEWRMIVESLPAEWFRRENHSLLVQYCRHIVEARRIAEAVAWVGEQLRGGDLEVVGAYDKLLAMQERESRIIVNAATRMRLTQQAMIDERKRKPSMQLTANPWDDAD